MKMRDKFSVSDGNLLVLTLIPEMMRIRTYRHQLRKIVIDYVLNKENTK